ncbi:hypothetical protein [Delftia deserti]|uniref:Uncharacterized protein n=1 Tax=Delftia deserti TaxID=1651218 RepID=A0ABW5ETE6_9BURK
MTVGTVTSSEFAARLAGLITGLPIGTDVLTHEQAASAFYRVSLGAEKLAREYAALALGQPTPVSIATLKEHHGL